MLFREPFPLDNPGRMIRLGEHTNIGGYDGIV